MGIPESISAVTFNLIPYNLTKIKMLLSLPYTLSLEMLVKQTGPKTAFSVSSAGGTWHLLSIKVFGFPRELVGSPTPQREEEVITKF